MFSNSYMTDNKIFGTYLIGWVDNFETNSAFTILSKKSDEVIQSVEFNWEIFGTNNNTFTLKSSMFGNSIFPTTYSQSKTGKLSQILFEANANALRFENSNSSYVGLKSIVVKTCSGEHAVVKNVKLVDGAVPEKRVYFEGEQFDPTGLDYAIVSFTNENISDFRLPISMVTFYDGPSYDEPADHSAKTTNLQADTTYVVGEILGYELRVSNLTVKSDTISLTLVKSVSEITNSGKYFITSPEAHALVLGTAGSDIKSSKGCAILSSVEFTDEISISKLYANDGFSITKNEDNGLYTIATLATGNKYGLTASYSDSSAAKPAFCEWSIEIDSETGIASIEINPAEDVVRYLTCSGSIIKPYDAKKTDIAIYKLA